MNALVYVDIDRGIHKVKLKNALNEKQKKTTWVFFFYKYTKFWSILPDKKVDLKPHFSEEWLPKHLNRNSLRDPHSSTACDYRLPRTTRLQKYVSNDGNTQWRRTFYFN